MAEVEEYRCFVGGLSRNTTDQGLEDAFRSFGNVLDAKVRIKDFCIVFVLMILLPVLKTMSEEFFWFFLIYLVD
jgi:RNA recognition motif-containing protein